MAYLHDHRGEQFRHSQNVRRDLTHLSSPSTYNSPTMPVSLTWSSEPQNEVESQRLPTPADTSDFSKVVAGPIPKSWP
jgi:hypothetical protein